jgi:predicted 3-demethylubiquinone-9 3-methyltransferase (glyoxalase superfamily)
MATTNRIIPHLWFDTEAVQAAEFYTRVFPASRIVGRTVIEGTPSGDCDFVAFDLWGLRFMGISAGPAFRFTPALSFLVNFDPSRLDDPKGMLDRAWDLLAKDGQALMPLGEYPFSDHYGWIRDRYGLSWQLMLTNPAGEPRPEIIPALLFGGKKAGQAEAAIREYTSVFQDSRVGTLVRHAAGPGPDKEGTVQFADFQLMGQWFAAMDSAYGHAFDFNEAVSLLVQCESQREIDAYSGALSAVPEAEACGWLKDRFGVSWQISASAMDGMLLRGTAEGRRRVVECFLKMKRLDLARLQAAYAGR